MKKYLSLRGQDISDVAKEGPNSDPGVSNAPQPDPIPASEKKGALPIPIPEETRL